MHLCVYNNANGSVAFYAPNHQKVPTMFNQIFIVLGPILAVGV